MSSHKPYADSKQARDLDIEQEQRDKPAPVRPHDPLWCNGYDGPGDEAGWREFLDKCKRSEDVRKRSLQSRIDQCIDARRVLKSHV